MTVTNLASLDLAEASEVVFDLELTNPANDEPLGIFVQLIGLQSDAVRGAIRKNTNEILKRDFEAQRKGGAKPPTAEDGERRGAETLAAGTVGWFTKEPDPKPGAPDKIEQGLPFGDARILFSTSEAIKLYANPGYAWLRAQVDKGIGETSNFLRS
jgi:hypothetical protein